MLILVWGTRPEALKLGAVAAALKARNVPFVSLSTGQHTDLLAGTPAETDLADSQSLGIRTTGEVLRWPLSAQPVIEAALRDHRATLVVVQGDTMSAVVGARAAARLGIPLAHVEAGIRSGCLDDPWPEEAFRREITTLATWHYAPTLCAYDHLIAEGVSAEAILLTGNPIVSAIARYADVVPVKVADLTILFTMHRREWRLGGIKSVLEGFHEAACQYPEVEIVWPVHPGVAKDLPMGWVSGLPLNARLVAPMAYRPTLRLLARSLGVATDSGGLQEEAACLGVPCAVLRRVTDRPESVEAGVARVYAPTGEGVLGAIRDLRERVIPRQPSDVFGTVAAATRIAVHLGGVGAESVAMSTTLPDSA